MSLEAMVAVLKLAAVVKKDLGVTLSTSELWLLMVIADGANDDGELSAYTRSQEYFAWKAGWSDTRSVRKLLRQIERKGLIESKRGVGGEWSTYRLTFLDRAPASSLSKIFWDLKKSAGAYDPAPAGSNDPAHNTTSSHSSITSDRPSRWFSSVFWPAYPEKADRLGAWRELRNLAPDKKLRATILTGLQRFIERRERVEIESSDGFVPAMPLAKNWLRDRRWEDE